MDNVSEKKNIVIVTNTMLYPARRNGASVRYYPIVKELTKRGYTVDLIIINKYYESYSDADITNARQVYGSIDIIETGSNTNLSQSLIKKITNASKLISPFGIPYCLIDNDKQFYVDELSRILKQRERYSYSIGAGIGGNTAIFLSELAPEIKPGKIVCDLIDSVYLLRKRSFRTTIKKVNPITWLEDRKTKHWEKYLTEKFTSVFISEEDALASNSNANIIPNCVVNDDFQSAEPVKLKSPSIGFIGNMGYKPNIEACDKLYDEIFPALLKRHPEAQLYIIGRNPGPALLEKNHHANIHITGEVDNIWRYIKSIDVFVFSIVSGAGLQNKVLEAMYAEKPVVCSAIANEGIEATHDKHLYIAETTDDYVRYIELALTDEYATNSDARQFIDDHFSIKKNTDAFEQALTGKPIH